MKIHPAAQGSVEWLEARAGIPTASEFNNLISPTLKIRTGEMPETYLHKKLAEYWQGGPLPSWSRQQSAEMEFGQILEERARAWFELETGLTIKQVGLCLTDDGRVGCSPDGLLGEHSGLELKCPAVHTHVGYLLSGGLPAEYRLQVQGSMYVTGRAEWHFVSYGGGRFPKLHLPIKRDDDAQAAIAVALAEFLERFAEGVKRLEEINGGPRPEPVKFDPHKYDQQESEPVGSMMI